MDKQKAREFCKAVKKLNEQFNLSFFFVTEGASITDNRGNEAVRHARLCHEEWEKNMGKTQKRSGEKWIEMKEKN